MTEYIELSAAIEAAKHAWAKGLEPSQYIEALPAADVAPVVHGRWEWFDGDVGTPVTGYEREWGWRCSHCGENLPDDYDDPDDSPKFRFCYNCGAKMDGGECE